MATYGKQSPTTRSLLKTNAARMKFLSILLSAEALVLTASPQCYAQRAVSPGNIETASRGMAIDMVMELY